MKKDLPAPHLAPPPPTYPPTQKRTTVWKLLLANVSYYQPIPGEDNLHHLTLRKYPNRLIMARKGRKQNQNIKLCLMYEPWLYNYKRQLGFGASFSTHWTRHYARSATQWTSEQQGRHSQRIKPDILLSRFPSGRFNKNAHLLLWRLSLAIVFGTARELRRLPARDAVDDVFARYHA